LRTKIRAREPKEERRGFVMKKAILIICVLSVLALLVVPVVAGVLIAEGNLDRLIAPGPDPGIGRQAKVERPTQIARIGILRPPGPMPPPRPPGGNDQL
jgi:hypothetical protein